MSNILVTGANGFIGSNLSAELLKHGNYVRGALRKPELYGGYLKNYSEIVVGEINHNTEWSKALDSIDTVVHLAAVTHQSAQLNDKEYFAQVNVLATKQLLESAIKAKVDKFIFISSVKVYGEQDFSDIVLDESSPVGVDCDLYGSSKLEAEKLIKEIAKNYPIEFVIIRVPLVYGAQVRANFKSLLQLLNTGVPLPFLGIDNKKSMVSVDNLVDFVWCCISHPKASNQTFLVSDMDDLSLPRLVRVIRSEMKLSARLFYLPRLLLSILFTFIGRKTQFRKLSSNLRISSNKANRLLAWKPITSVESAMSKTVKAYLRNKQ